MADEVKKLIDDYEKAVDALVDDTEAGIEQSRKAWKKMKKDEYSSSAFFKDATKSYARSVNTWRKILGDWMQ